MGHSEHLGTVSDNTVFQWETCNNSEPRQDESGPMLHWFLVCASADLVL